MKVICTLPNAADRINGVAFSPGDGGMVSEDISQEQGNRFLAIPGYKEVQRKLGRPPKPKEVSDGAEPQS